MKNIIIIGAGGVASYLLLPLIKTFRPEQVILIDKDVVEEKNLERQSFLPDDVGKGKAEKLAEKTRPEIPDFIDTEIFYDFRWFEDTWTPGSPRFEPDAVFCCADNHEARLAAIRFAEAKRIPVYIGGNEYFDAEAYLWFPGMEAVKHPLAVYPNLLTDKTGSPLHCDSEEALEATPQLAVANMTCAALLLRLAWLHQSWAAKEVEDPDERDALRNRSLPAELAANLTGFTTR